MTRLGRSFPAAPIILTAVLAAAPVTGTAAVVQDDQTMVGAGATSGTIAVTQDDATMVAAGYPTTTGTIAVTQDAQTMSMAGTTTVTGTVAVTQDAQTLTAVDVVVLYPASISGRKLLDQNGDVYLAKLFSSWSMASHLSNADITQALTDVAANGFNGITMWCGGTEDRGTSGWDKYTNLAGQNYWTGTPWASSLGAAWASVDWVVAECARLGLVLHFSFCHGWGGNGHGPDWEATSDANMTAAGVAIATRYAASTNIVWHVMFDSPVGPTDTAGVKIRKLFDGINATEGASTRPVRWCEPDNSVTTNEAGWYDPTGASTSTRFSINCLYEWGGDSASHAEFAYGETSGPIGDCEPVYVGNTDAYGADRQQLRERPYAVFLEGGSLINWGHEDWWPFGAAKLFDAGETWQTVVTDDETVEASYCWALIDTYCADTTWAPTSSFVTTGAGTGDTKAAAGASSTAALAYFPTNRTVAVDTTIIAGTGNVRLRWYDPTAGTFSTIAASEAQTSGRSVTLPAAHGDGSRDWVLVVDEPPESTGTVAVTQDAQTMAAAGTTGTNKLKVGATPITALKLGTTTVTKAYQGTTVVWQP